MEWLKEPSEEELILFRRDGSPVEVCSGRAEMAPGEVAAAALGSALATRGQFGSFDWGKARELLWLKECSVKRTPIKNGVFEGAREEAAPSQEPAEPPADPMEKAPVKTPQGCGMCGGGAALRENPFPKEFPESVWYRYDYASPGGGWHYLSGTIFRQGVPVSTATAVPGRSGMKPPEWLREFSMFLHSAENAQGYWIAVSPYLSTNQTEE